MANTVAGRAVLMYASGAATTISITSSPETPTACFSGVNATNGWQTTGCYLFPASNHAIFTVTATSSGGFNRVLWVGAREKVGLVAFDTNCTAGAASCSLTTANASEWLDVGGADLANDLTPHTGFFQEQWGMTDALIGSQNIKFGSWSQITGGAGSVTAQYDESSPFPLPSIVAMAFTQNAPTKPSVYKLQSCYFAYPDTTRTSATCALHNYTANNIIVYGFADAFDPADIALCLGTSCNCPANARNTPHVYAGINVQAGLCIASTNTNQSTYSVGINMHGGLGQTGLFIQAAEWAGLTGVLDAGSETSALALTTSYTTAANNEQTFTVCFDAITNPLVPNSSELQIASGTDIDTSFAASDQQLTQSILTTAAGSNTTSCAMSAGSVRPIIATLSMGISSPPATATRHKGQIL
jgi:hypothetical protein